MFEAWHDFYLVLGPAAAGLIGLLFVVVSLMSGRDREKMVSGTRVFLTPIVFHLGALVLMSALALFPNVSGDFVGAAAFACGFVGLAYAAYICRAFLSKAVESYEGDLWRYGLGVGALYTGLVVAGVLILFRAAIGPYVLAADQIAMFLLMVHNAWDLVLFIAPQRNDPPDAAGG